MTDKKPSQSKGIVESLLSKFILLNPQSQLSSKDDNIIIKKLWGVDDWYLDFPIHNSTFIKKLNEIHIDPHFDAIIQKNKNMEVFYGFLKPDEAFIGRKIDLYLCGQKLICEYRKPSDAFWEFITHIKANPGATGEYAGQLRQFTDYLNISNLPTFIQKYFKDKVPINFHIKFPRNINLCNLKEITEHVNFLMHYYDRKTPIINIRDEGSQAGKSHKSIQYIEESFPKSISTSKIDENILKLIDVANTSNSRHAFVYYYQVFEYAGYYYIEDRLKRKVINLIKDPVLIGCPEEKIENLLVLFCDLNQNDDTKMKKVIEECCNPNIIWKEIEKNKAAYIKSIEFDGGFSLPPLLPESIDNTVWCSMWMPKTFDYLTKIRNCLVHARERRENKVILPTDSNSEKLSPFVPVIQRMAEQIAINTSQ